MGPLLLDPSEFVDDLLAFVSGVVASEARESHGDEV